LGERVAVGNLALALGEGAQIPAELELSQDTLVYVVRGGKLIGAVSIGDEVKAEAKQAISELYSLGVKKTVILSGDRCDRVLRIGRELGISEVHGELLPDDKYRKLEELSSSTVAYVGDGINDAPALTLADVGIAMGGVGSDSAKESADVVLVSDELTRIPEAVRIAKRTLRIAKENIVFALGVKLSILVLGAFGIAGMWLAVFADVGVAVLAILNSMRTLVTKRGK
jgi:Cd2+/Zn2+-exporting ATPase